MHLEEEMPDNASRAFQQLLLLMNRLNYFDDGNLRNLFQLRNCSFLAAPETANGDKLLIESVHLLATLLSPNRAPTVAQADMLIHLVQQSQQKSMSVNGESEQYLVLMKALAQALNQQQQQHELQNGQNLHHDDSVYPSSTSRKRKAQLQEMYFRQRSTTYTTGSGL
ncbi:hypothetical protein Ciccas_008303 [Cichlidogyrus casuarinus]|uniref:Uncharacterized protein n=1 Tax=Cichlidogyrus casuarinus TaxID=1844966 RepID=A0ABD2Q160_9PLAT